MKFLIDEDLSPRLAEWVCARCGVDAVHVRDRGLLGASDRDVLAFAFSEDRILVTANVKDFQRLARSVSLHPGIVLVLEGCLSRDEQWGLIQRVVQLLEEEQTEGRDMINRVLEIDAKGSADFYDLPV